MSKIENDIRTEVEALAAGLSIHDEYSYQVLCTWTLEELTSYRKWNDSFLKQRREWIAAGRPIDDSRMEDV